jgi:hypothetical protein
LVVNSCTIGALPFQFMVWANLTTVSTVSNPSSVNLTEEGY